MFESRYQIVKKKPKLVLTKSFSFTDKLNIGDKGVINAVVYVDALRLEADENGNDKFFGILIIRSAELLSQKKRIND